MQKVPNLRCIQTNLENMKKTGIAPKPSDRWLDLNNQNDFKGYPIYPANEDIFNQLYEEKNIDPEDFSEIKPSFHADFPGNDLDIPGSELDDYQEEIGSEDEENNYYSLGGDNHENLEENREN